MEQQDLIDEMETNPVRKRPVFLLVICILTWVGCAFSLISSGFQFFMFSSLSNSMKDFGGGEFNNMYNMFLWNALIGCLGALFCVAGSIVMFTLRKWGFYLYVAGQVIPMAVSAYTSLSVSSTNYMSMVFMFAGWVIPLGFIVMYALNLKYMKRYQPDINRK